MGSATCLGLLFHQLACKYTDKTSPLRFAHFSKVVVHDAGHTEVTGIWWWDRVIGMTVASWIGGLSCSWWCDVSLNEKQKSLLIKRKLTGTSPRTTISTIVRLFT